MGVEVIMESDWLKITFSEAILINPSVPLKRGILYSYVDMQSIDVNRKFVYEKEERIFNGGGSRFKYKDVLMARITPCLENGKIAVFNSKSNEGFGSTEFIIFREKPNFSTSDFIYYLTSWDYVKNFAITNMSGTSGRQRVPTSSFEHLIINLPPLSEQKAIAHILSSFDDKIELNRQMNETLEAMARAIFKSWFVDFDPVSAKRSGRQPAGMDTATADLFPDEFEESSLGLIPKGWNVETLDKVTEFVLGGDWGKDSISEEMNQPVYCIRGADIPDLQNSGVGKMPVRYLKDSSLKKRSLKPGDIVIEISGGSPTQSTGRPVLVTSNLLDRLPYPLVCSNFCRLVRLKTGISPSFIYLWLRWLYSSDSFLQYENGTTGIKNFAYKIFSDQYELILPSDQILAEFEKIIQILFDNRDFNGLQSETLTNIRDTLLPKLMSGEIRVKEAEKDLMQKIQTGGTL
jgi:type I restriction enzyme S subunit